MKPNIVVDTNVLCALYNPQDSLYVKTQKIKPLLIKYKPIVSNFILLETYTILSQRVSKEFSVAFGKRIREIHLYSIIWIDRKLEDDVWNIFASINDKNFSYVDASTLAVMKKEKIKHLLSFDQGFSSLQQRFGFRLIGA